MSKQLKNPINPKMGYFYRIVQNLVNNVEEYVLAVAGYSYDEVKNAFGVGNKAIAVGEDQFVFGRGNYSDDQKAEIVGAGSQYKLGDVITPANPELDYYDMIYAGHGLEELKQFLVQYYNLDLEHFSIADEHRKASAITPQGQVWYDIPNVADYDKLYFVIFEDAIDENIHRLWFYGYSMEDQAIYQPFSELQAHYYIDIVDGVKYLGNVEDTMTLRSLLNPLSRLNKSGNYYKSFISLRDSLHIRTLDWDGTQRNSGDIICKDEDGSDISMRDLLSRIKALETPTTTTP